MSEQAPAVISIAPWDCRVSEYDAFVLVEEGRFLMGSGEADASPEQRPQRSIHLDAFYVSRFPVTNGQYQRFLKDCEGEPPRYWQGYHYNEYLENHPVNFVRWDMAAGYCQWLGRKTGKRILLPSEAQWEKAARGTDGRQFPWGNERPNFGRANFANNVGETTPVDLYPKGVSPYGCWDMAGNVPEWTRDSYAEDWLARMPDVNPVNEALELNPDKIAWGIRSGDYASGSYCLCETYRQGGGRIDHAGFRCVCEPEKD